MENKQNIFSLLIIYLIAFVQGAAFTLTPSAANFLTDPNGFQFSPLEYGWLFIPLAFGAIFASFFTGFFGKYLSLRSLVIAISFLNTLSMILYALSQTTISKPEVSFPMLLLVLFLLGAGFGANLVLLNPFMIHYYSDKPKLASLSLLASLGFGMSISPLLFNLFFYWGVWWVSPLLLGLGFLGLIIASVEKLPKEVAFPIENEKTIQGASWQFFWMLLTAVFLYGLIEGSLSNWGTIFLHQERGIEPLHANYSISSFWGAVTIGRIIIALLVFLLSARYIYVALPIILLASIFCINLVVNEEWASGAFALAGLGCSGFLPLSLYFAERNFSYSSLFVSSLLFAAYMFGYGLSSVSNAFFFHLSFNLSTMFLWLIAPIVFLEYLAFKNKTS